MIDAEVIRLRRLRNTALRARANARALDSGHARSDTLFLRSARACWRVARAATGRLRSHPYLSYQRDPGYARAKADGAFAELLSGIARIRGRRMRTCALEMQRVAQELDDVRALTWSQDLSDTLGRAQSEIRLLLKALIAGARLEAGLHVQVDARLEAGGGGVRNDGPSVAANWPYLAL